MASDKLRQRTKRQVSTTESSEPQKNRSNDITGQGVSKDVNDALKSSSHPLWQACLVYGVADIAGCLISFYTNSHVHLDLVGTGAFALFSVSCWWRSRDNQRFAMAHTWASSVLISIWSIRLAGFLFFRATQIGRDGRLEELLSKPAGIIGFWTVSFVWNVACTLPYLLGMSSSQSLSRQSHFGWVSLGSLVSSVGIVVEVLADWQKWTFKQTNPGQFCNVGLWQYSQHPNYFGNLLVFVGIFILNVPALIDRPVKQVSKESRWTTLWRHRRLLVSLYGPLFLFTIFYSQAIGTGNNTLELAAAKYGNDPAYQQYLEQVPRIIPTLW